MEADIASHASFDDIRYAQLWEDAYLLVEALGEQRGRTLVSICSAGDNALAMLTLDPARDTMYVATGDNYSDPPTQLSDAVVALRMSNGDILWSRQLTPGDAWNSSCMLVDKVNCPDSDGPDFDFAASAEGRYDDP